MKKLILILIAFTATHSFAQTAKDVWSGKSMPVEINQSRDSSLQVIIVDKGEQVQQPVYFVNGRFVKNCCVPISLYTNICHVGNPY